MRTKMKVAIYKKDLCTGQKTNQPGNEINRKSQEKIRDTNVGETLGFCWNFTGFLLVSLRSVPTLEM